MAKDKRIEVKKASKSFRVPHEKTVSLKQTLVSVLSRKTYSRLSILKDINFSIDDGEFVGIVGKNGSGKSTLLKMLAGIYQPNSGEVDIFGKIVPFLELGVGFNPELTARENIYLNGAILGLTTKQIDNIFNEVIAFAELGEFVDQKLKNFSSGMQVRLAFSIAIRADFDILLLDEVLAVGDANFQEKCFKVFREYQRAKRTVVFVSHDMDKIQEYCTRAIYIRDGELVLDGKPADVAAQYALDYSDKMKTITDAGPKDSGFSIESFKFDDGSKNRVANEEDEIYFEIEYKASRVAPLIINVGLFKDDQYVAGFNTNGSIGKFKCKKGLNKVSCTMAPGQLGKGDYWFAAMIFEHTTQKPLLARVNDVASLHIGSMTIGHDGIMNVKDDWKVVK